MKFKIKDSYLVASIEEKENYNIYLLLDMVKFEKVSIVGSKFDVKPKDIVEAVIELTVERLRIIDQSGTTNWVNHTSFFLRDLKKADKQK